MSQPVLPTTDSDEPRAQRRSTASFWPSLLACVAATAAQFWVVTAIVEPARTVLLALTIAVEYAALAWIAGSAPTTGL